MDKHLRAGPKWDFGYATSIVAFTLCALFIILAAFIDNVFPQHILFSFVFCSIFSATRIYFKLKTRQKSSFFRSLERYVPTEECRTDFSGRAFSRVPVEMKNGKVINCGAEVAHANTEAFIRKYGEQAPDN